MLEASRLRTEHREIDPVEIYGSALTALWHGADELAWWHHSHVMDTSHTTGRAEVSQACVRGVYGLLEKIGPWLEGLRPQPGVAVLFSRASCDLWRLYLQAKGTQPPFDARGLADSRHAAIVQKEVLYLLLRTGVPTTLYYLESVGKAELAPHQVILVPQPLAIGRERAKLLADLAGEGKRIVICGDAGSLDEDGTPYGQPLLEGLLKQRQASFVPAAVLDRLASHRENEKRTRQERILPSVVDAAAAGELLSAIAGDQQSAAVRPLMTGRLPAGDDIPVIAARMEPTHNLVRFLVIAGQIGTFVGVAQTAECKIVWNGLPAVLLGDDMVDLKWPRMHRLRHAAVLADPVCPTPNEFFQLAIHAVFPGRCLPTYGSASGEPSTATGPTHHRRGCTSPARFSPPRSATPHAIWRPVR